jgi:hypothetical protein
MSSEKPTRSGDLFLYAVIGVYLLIGLLLFPLYRYQINPDGISYISIAQKYLSGVFMAACAVACGRY